MEPEFVSAPVVLGLNINNVTAGRDSGTNAFIGLTPDKGWLHTEQSSFKGRSKSPAPEYLDAADRAFTSLVKIISSTWKGLH